MVKRYYAAYGSNLNVQQMMKRCPGARIAGTSVIEGYELLFKGSKTGSYLTIEPSVKNHVPVGVWEVGHNDEVRLDVYEGYPSFYYKKVMTLPVKLLDGSVKDMEAFVYIMDPDRQLGLPNRNYLCTCLKGYDNFGFNEQYLIDAYMRSKEHEE